MNKRDPNMIEELKELERSKEVAQSINYALDNDEVIGVADCAMLALRLLLEMKRSMACMVDLIENINVQIAEERESNRVIK